MCTNTADVIAQTNACGPMISNQPVVNHQCAIWLVAVSKKANSVTQKTTTKFSSRNNCQDSLFVITVENLVREHVSTKVLTVLSFSSSCVTMSFVLCVC